LPITAKKLVGKPSKACLKQLKRLPLVDALIAAAAQAKEAILVHRDAHMRAIPSSLIDQQDLTPNHT